MEQLAFAPVLIAMQLWEETYGVMWRWLGAGVQRSAWPLGLCSTPLCAPSPPAGPSHAADRKPRARTGA